VGAGSGRTPHVCWTLGTEAACSWPARLT